jgi:hypothetical protein
MGPGTLVAIPYGGNFSPLFASSCEICEICDTSLAGSQLSIDIKELSNEL